MKVLLIDNYDSFTYNLFQYIAEITGIIPSVFFNDTLTWSHFLKNKFDAIVISPGPGDPRNKKDFGICREVIQKSTVPLLGICLGHQGIGDIFGAEITHAPTINHGKASKIYHTGKGLFKDIPQGFEAIRYHSLVVSPDHFPETLAKTAWTKDDVIMALEHKEKQIYGVQFHPESIGTKWGKKLLANFFGDVKK